MANIKKIICPECGVVVEIDLDEVDPEEEWLPCLLPEGFEWRLPAGKIEPVVGEVLYVDAIGKQYTRTQYIERYNIDPQIAFERMRASR